MFDIKNNKLSLKKTYLIFLIFCMLIFTLIFHIFSFINLSLEKEYKIFLNSQIFNKSFMLNVKKYIDLEKKEVKNDELNIDSKIIEEEKINVIEEIPKEFAAKTKKDKNKLKNENKITKSNKKKLKNYKILKKDDTKDDTKKEKTLKGIATAYTSKKGAKTSTGSIANIGTFAVNPEIIPYGSLMVVNVGGKVLKGIALDTGKALKNNSILLDVYMETVDECKAFGKREVTITYI